MSKNRKRVACVLMILMVCLQSVVPSVKAEAATELHNNATGYEGSYRYELWKDYGDTSMILKGDGLFECSWGNIGNALFRKGVKYDCTKTYSQIGNIYVNYGVDYQPNGNSYLCVYGWSRNPLVEYYIVDSWGTWRPPGAVSKGTITVDGGTYDVYETTRVNQPSIDGTATFKQYWSVRTSKRTSGVISVTEHFKAWERMGMNMGLLYEASLTVEGYQSSGWANVYKLEITEGNNGSTDENLNNGNTSNGNTAGGNTAGGNTAGGNTAGGNTAGGNTSNGNTAGGNTSNGNTSNGNTSGGNSKPSDTAGGNTNGNGGASSAPGTNKGTVVECESMTKSGPYVDFINQPFDGVALFGNDDTVTAKVNFTSGTHDFTLRGAADGNRLARVEMFIGGEYKGTFYYGDANVAEYTIKNVSHKTGEQKIELKVLADDGSWDVYADCLIIGGCGVSVGSASSAVINTGNVMECEKMEKSGTYTGDIQAPFQGVALYANDDTVSYIQNFTGKNSTFILTGASNGNALAQVDLYIGGEKKGTFYYGDANIADYVIENVSHEAGKQKVELKLSADDGSWDAYIDKLTLKEANTSDEMQCEEMRKSGPFVDVINVPFDGMALYANGDSLSYTQYFTEGVHNFTLRGASSCNNMARVDLYIGNEKKGTFYYGDAYIAEYTIYNVSHGTGYQTVKLVLTEDIDSWDAYGDCLKISPASAGGTKNETETVPENPKPSEPSDVLEEKEPVTPESGENEEKPEETPKQAYVCLVPVYVCPSCTTVKSTKYNAIHMVFIKSNLIKLQELPKNAEEIKKLGSSFFNSGLLFWQ